MKKPIFPLRTWLEFIGTLLLILGIYAQRDLITHALKDIQHAQVSYLAICLSLTWLLFAWSASGYKLLLTKHIKFRSIFLAHLAAAGPGRVLPGGAGQLSFGTLFLKKQGLSLPRAIALAFSNNFVGITVNVLVLIAIFALDPNLLDTLKITPYKVSASIFATIVIIGAALIIRRNRRLKKATNGTGKEITLIWNRLRQKPMLLVLLILTMLATMSTNAFILVAAAHAIELQISFGAAIVAISTGVAVGSFVPTPGGIGGVEAGLVATLYLLGFDLQLATSAALVYRFTTYIVPFIPGIFAYVYLRRKKML